MRALLCKKYGLPKDMVIEEVADLSPNADEIIVDVKACGLNFPDTLIIQGKYQFQPKMPFSPGGEVSGFVRSVGSKVSHLKVGDRVMAGTSWGGFAQQARSLASNAFAISDKMSFDQAAGSVMTFGTSYHALCDRADIKKGETLLVLGAAGGVGTSAIQIAKQLGVQVIAAASSESKLNFCLNQGADFVINYTKEDLKKRAKELTDGKGVDVIFDPIGGALSEIAFRSVARKGRHLVIGFASGDIPKIPWNLPLL